MNIWIAIIGIVIAPLLATYLLCRTEIWPLRADRDKRRREAAWIAKMAMKRLSNGWCPYESLPPSGMICDGTQEQCVGCWLQAADEATKEAK